MNLFFQTYLCLLLLLSFSSTAAEKEEFDQILEAIRQADLLIEEGKDRQAIAQFQLAQRTLLQFKSSYPDWDKKVVSFRLNYLNEQLEKWDGKQSTDSTIGSVNTEEPTQERVDYLERANNQYQFQLKQLHDENARLSMKLREALALRPASLEPAVVAETQTQLERLQIDHAKATEQLQALKKELASYPEPELAKQNVQILEETQKNLNQVIAEAEELRLTNEVLRKETATRPIPTQGGSEALHREILAAQAALQLGESEAIRLRKENENLNLRLASLEARFNSVNTTGSPTGIPQLNKVDSARLALARDNSDEAARMLSEVLQDNPRDAEALYLMGRTLFLQGQLNEAELSLKKVLELSPDSGVTHYELAHLYHAKDAASPGLARWHYHKALNLGYPRNVDFEKNIRWEQPGG